MKATTRSRKNMIQSLQVGDVTVVDQQQKEDIFWDHFNSILGAYQPPTARLNLAQLGMEFCDLSDLERDFTEEEVKKAVFDIHPEKASGPDGFTGLFFRHCWTTVKNEVMLTMQKLQTLNSQSLHLLNTATLVLLPKHSGAAQPNEFRPISLVHFFAKLVAKILATSPQDYNQRCTLLLPHAKMLLSEVNP